MTLLLCFALGIALVLTGCVGLWEIMRESTSASGRRHMQRRKMREVMLTMGRNATRIFAVFFAGALVLCAAAVGVFELAR